jgi:hypothetical protein
MIGLGNPKRHGKAWHNDLIVKLKLLKILSSSCAKTYRELKKKFDPEFSEMKNMITPVKIINIRYRCTSLASL